MAKAEETEETVGIAGITEETETTVAASETISVHGTAGIIPQVRQADAAAKDINKIIKWFGDNFCLRTVFIICLFTLFELLQNVKQLFGHRHSQPSGVFYQRNALVCRIKYCRNAF